MLIVFRVGKSRKYDDWDVIDVISRKREPVVRKQGLGKGAKQFFWVEVDTDELSDDQFKALAHKVTDFEGHYSATERTIHKRIRRKVERLRRYQMNPKYLEKIQPDFWVDIAAQATEAEVIYPSVKMSLAQFRKLLINKETGRSMKHGD